MTHSNVEDLLRLDDGAGPALRLSAARADALIAGALSAWQPGPGGGPDGGGGGGGAPPSGVLWPKVLGGTLSAVAVGAMVGYVAMRAPTHITAPTPIPEVAPPEAADPSAFMAAEPEDAGFYAIEFTEDEAGPRRRVRRSTKSVDDLLQEANEARRERRWQDAERTYLRAAREHPGTQGAYVATVSAAALRLDKLGDARGARALYRRALRQRPTGPLAAEVRLGLANASKRLGDRDGERAALEGLVRRHSASPFADRARARLAELDGQE